MTTGSSRHPDILAGLIGRRSAVVVATSSAVAPLAPAAQYTDLVFELENGGSALTTGVKKDLRVGFDCEIVSWSLLLDVSATVRVDVWRDSFSAYPPTVTFSMPDEDANKPQTSAAIAAEGIVSSDWARSKIDAGDCLRINIDVTSTATRATLVLKVKR